MGLGGIFQDDSSQKSCDSPSKSGDAWADALQPVSKISQAHKDSNGERRERYCQMACLCFTFFVLGMCLSLIGPALPTLADNLEVLESKLYFILTSRGLGYFLGSLLCGFLLRKMTPNSLIAISLIINCVGHLIAPFCPNAIMLATDLGFIGIAMGALETSANVYCLAVWGTESKVGMQITHFFLALGCIAAPIVARPFLHEPAQYVKHPNVTKYSSRFSLQDELRNNTITSVVRIGHFPTIAWLFIIAAALSALSASLYAITKHTREDGYFDSKKATSYTEEKSFRLKVIAVLFVFFMLNAGMEMTFGMYIYSFAIHCELHYEKRLGAALNTLFMSAFAVGCFISIYAAKHISPRDLLIVDLIGTTIATVGMSLLPVYWNSAAWILWVSIGLFGLSIANAFPAAITWAENFITVDGSATSAFVVGCSLGEMVVPFIVGIIFKADPNNLTYFCFVANAICGIMFVLVLVLSKQQAKRMSKQEHIALVSNGNAVDTHG